MGTLLVVYQEILEFIHMLGYIEMYYTSLNTRKNCFFLGVAWATHQRQLVEELIQRVCPPYLSLWYLVIQGACNGI